MGILQLPTSIPAMVGVLPNFKFMVTTDNLATITAAGYLNQVNLESNPIAPNDVLNVLYSYNQQTNSGTYAQFVPTIANGVVTIALSVDSGNVLLPVVSGNFAVFNGTTGQIKDAGFLPSNPAKTISVMANGATILNHIATYVDTTGTIGEDAATAINGGNIQAGLSGTAGSLISFPGTAASGSLALVAANSAGNFAGIITNASLGQASTWTIADPGAAASKLLQAAGVLVSGNVLKASGTAGLMVDAGFALHAGTTAAYGGGGTSNTFTTTNMTSSSIVTAVILASTNSVAITKALPGTNTLAVTFSADPGAGTTVSWISITPAVA